MYLGLVNKRRGIQHFVQTLLVRPTAPPQSGQGNGGLTPLYQVIIRLCTTLACQAQKFTEWILQIGVFIVMPRIALIILCLFIMLKAIKERLLISSILAGHVSICV